jgi:class 3 adenylate cyclase
LASVRAVGQRRRDGRVASVQTDRYHGTLADPHRLGEGVRPAAAVPGGRVERSDASGLTREGDPSAGERYLLLADLSGYTRFMTGVERDHGVDFSAGIPAAYSILGDLLGAVTEGLEPDFAVVKLEGDAVFAAAPAAALDGRGTEVVGGLQTMYGAFVASRTRAIPSADHVCTACPAVAGLDLKIVLHRGPAVRQAVGSGSDLLGPAVTLAHRLLKNSVRERIGSRPYLLLTDAAATALGLPGIGLTHHEEYPDAGHVDGRIVELQASRD